MIRNIVFDMGNVLIHWCPDDFLARLELTGEDRSLLRQEVFGCVEWVQTDRGTLSDERAAAAMKTRLPSRLHWAVDRLMVWWLYLLSNASVRQPEYFTALPVDRYLDGRILSSSYKLLKPQPEIYRVLLQEYDLRAEECFFVDDLFINVEAAMLVGMSGAIFRGAAPLRQALAEAGVGVKV